MMDAWLLLAIMLLLLVLAAAFSVTYNLKLSHKVIEQFRELGERFGLELTIPKRTMFGLYQRNPTLYGSYEGREMSIYPKGYGLDNTRQTDIAVRLMTKAPKDLAFSLAHRGMTAKLGQIGRLKDTPTGNADFDTHFNLRSNNAGAAKAIFGPDLRDKILKEWTASSGFLSLHSRALEYVEQGLPRTDLESQHIEIIASLCLEIADHLDGFTA